MLSCPIDFSMGCSNESGDEEDGSEVSEGGEKGEIAWSLVCR